MTLRFAISSQCLRKAGTLACMAALAAAFVPCAQAQHGPRHHKENKHTESREIEGIESQWRDAMVKGDTVQLGKIMSDDFLAISANGMLSNKEQYLQRMQARQNQFSAIDLIDSKVRIQPGTAIVTSQARVSGQLDGKPIDGLFRYTKVYSREPGGPWQLTNFEATRVSGSRQDDSVMQGGTPLRSSMTRPVTQ